jgi:alkylhydroperoxidase family enzyme
VSRAHGVTEQQLVELPRWQESAAFSEEERLVLEYAEAMTRTPVQVPDALFARLRARFDEAQLVELTAALAWENYRARFNHALGVESEGLAEGAACLLPARPAMKQLP